MSTRGSRRPRAVLPASLAASPAPALAQAGAPDLAPQVAAGGVVIGVMLLFLWGAWLLLRHLSRELRGAGEAAGARLPDLPLGVPEGSVRALLSVFIIVFGFLLLALAGPLGLRAGEALTGFIGAVISFYFAARAGERGAETAREAARQVLASVTAPAAPAAAPAEPLRDAAARLQALRPMLSAAAGLALGTGAVAGAAEALDRVDGLLARLAPVLEGEADAATLARLAEEAGSLLEELGEFGPVGTALTDAAAAIGAAASGSEPIARGLGALLGGAALGGPAGLVAALVAGGIGLLHDRDRFARWKAAMLDTPLDLGLLPPAPDAGLAAAALLRCPPMAARLAPDGTVEPALALAVWEAVGPRAGALPAPAATLAARLLAREGPEALRTAFAGSPEALAEAIEDLRAAMTGAAALAGLDGTTATLADTLRLARQDGRIAAETDRLVFLVEALGRADPPGLARLAARIASPGFWSAAR
jgi:hypothetical protein